MRRGVLGLARAFLQPVVSRPWAQHKLGRLVMAGGAEAAGRGLGLWHRHTQLWHRHTQLSKPRRGKCTDWCIKVCILLLI